MFIVKRILPTKGVQKRKIICFYLLLFPFVMTVSELESPAGVELPKPAEKNEPGTKHQFPIPSASSAKSACFAREGDLKGIGVI